MLQECEKEQYFQEIQALNQLYPLKVYLMWNLLDLDDVDCIFEVLKLG